MHEAQRLEIELVDNWDFGERESHGRDDVGDSDLLLLDELAELPQIESLHNVRGDAAVEGREHKNGDAWDLLAVDA